MLFVGYLIDEGKKSRTIRSYVSALKAVLMNVNEEINENSVLLSSLTRAYKLHNDRVTTKLPISKHMLWLILSGVTKLFDIPPQPYLEILYKTLFMTAYFGLFRIGELTESAHNVKAVDVHVGLNKDKLMFVLHSSKMHTKGVKPQIIKINAIGQLQEKLDRTSKIHTVRSLCPFQAIQQYIKVRKKRKINVPEEPFFIFNDRKAVKPNNFRFILKKAIRTMGLDDTFYSSQGFHSGRACDLLDMGISVETIRKLGRWKSTSVYTYLHT